MAGTVRVVADVKETSKMKTDWPGKDSGKPALVCEVARDVEKCVLETEADTKTGFSKARLLAAEGGGLYLVALKEAGIQEEASIFGGKAKTGENGTAQAREVN